MSVLLDGRGGSFVAGFSARTFNPPRYMHLLEIIRRRKPIRR
jgi:hypothetical protein